MKEIVDYLRILIKELILYTPIQDERAKCEE